MSNVLDVADLKVILMLCLAQQVFVRELFAKYVVVLIIKYSCHSTDEADLNYYPA